MGFAYWFSKRLRLKGAPASTTTGAVIAVAGVALSVAVMLLSLAVTAGFKHEIERKVMGFTAPVSVLPPYDYTTASSAEYLVPDSALTQLLARELPVGATMSSRLDCQAILKTDSDFMAVQCQAFGPGHDDAFERSVLIGGTLPAQVADSVPPGICLSAVMASRLGLGLDERVYLYFFADGRVQMRRPRVAGIYQSNFGEYDETLVYVPMPMLQGVVADTMPLCTAIDIQGIAKDDIDTAADALQTRLLQAYSTGELKHAYPVTTVTHTGAVFFNWLDLLDTNVVVIFILMACVAALTLISSLFIIILDHIPTIGVLRAMGMGRGVVSRVFAITAMRLGGAGMVLGNALALAIIYAQWQWQLIPLDPQMYYLDHVPVRLTPLMIAALNAGVAMAIWLVLLLPARLAARVQPAQAMRFE